MSGWACSAAVSRQQSNTPFNLNPLHRPYFPHPAGVRRKPSNIIFSEQASAAGPPNIPKLLQDCGRLQYSTTAYIQQYWSTCMPKPFIRSIVCCMASAGAQVVRGMLPSRYPVATEIDCTIELQMRKRAHARRLHDMHYPISQVVHSVGSSTVFDGSVRTLLPV